MKKYLIILVFIIILQTNISAFNTKKSNKTINKYKGIKRRNSARKNYPTQAGTIIITTDAFKNILPIGHAGLVINKDYIYEATSKGVVRGRNNWLLTKKKIYAANIKGINRYQKNLLLNYMRVNLNKKYNYNYFDTRTRKKFYCSHLIWAAAYDKLKINLDTLLFGKAGQRKGAIHPIELILSNKTKLIFYYANK